ncbi:hypothetical protein [Archangium lipolyticum]|uniref:hypothetical protein n=1 Tax=Archangium lipolyticum TaxID=2970465 RepID=UPI00214A5B76|nr:hypothetical protein [Archangium lipolyticum]
MPRYLQHTVQRMLQAEHEVASPGAVVPSQGAAPVSEDVLAAYHVLRGAISPAEWARLNGAARARGVGSAATPGQRGQVLREVQVPLDRLLYPRLASGDAGGGNWKIRLFQQLTSGGDSQRIGILLVDEVLRRWRPAHADLLGTPVRVALVDPQAETATATSLVFQLRGRAIPTLDGALFLGQVDPEGMEAVQAQVAAEADGVRQLAELDALVTRAISDSRAIISREYRRVASSTVRGWMAFLEQLQARVSGFSQEHADLTGLAMGISSRLSTFLTAEARPFATGHAEAMARAQPTESYGERETRQIHESMDRAGQLMQGAWYERLFAGQEVVAAGNRATNYGLANVMTGGAPEASREMHEAFRAGDISLEDFEQGVHQVQVRGAIVGTLNVALLVAGGFLSGPLMGAAPTLLRQALVLGGLGAFSTAAMMTAESAYTAYTPLSGAYAQALWRQHQYTPGQIARASALSFGLGAAMPLAGRLVGRLLSRVDVRALQTMARASASGQALQPVPGLSVQQVSPGVLQVSIAGEAGHIHVTAEGFTVFGPAGQHGTLTPLGNGTWRSVRPELLAQHPTLAPFRGGPLLSSGGTPLGVVTTEDAWLVLSQQHGVAGRWGRYALPAQAASIEELLAAGGSRVLGPAPGTPLALPPGAQPPAALPSGAAPWLLPSPPGPLPPLLPPFPISPQTERLRAIAQALTRSHEDIMDMIRMAPSSREEERYATLLQLRNVHNAPYPPEFAGYMLESTVAENQAAIATAREQLRALSPDVVVGIERGGAFLAEATTFGDELLRPRLRALPSVKAPKTAKTKYDTAAMRQSFEALIQGGARHIVVVDAYMGGRTAGELRDTIYKPLVQRYPDVRIDTLWLREEFGFERLGGMGVTVRPPRQIPPGSPLAPRLQTLTVPVSFVLGDDMNMVVDRSPASREPLRIFNDRGEVIQTIHPREGETTRDALIRLLNGLGP